VFVVGCPVHDFDLKAATISSPPKGRFPAGKADGAEKTAFSNHARSRKNCNATWAAWPIHMLNRTCGLGTAAAHPTAHDSSANLFSPMVWTLGDSKVSVKEPMLLVDRTLKIAHAALELRATAAEKPCSNAVYRLPRCRGADCGWRGASLTYIRLVLYFFRNVDLRLLKFISISTRFPILRQSHHVVSSLRH
jgi:hypothetical protein